MIAHQLTLWRKELRQQRWHLLAAALVLTLMGVIVGYANASSDTATSRLSVLSECLLAFVPVLALTQAHATVVREYRQRSQLFVDALPLRRWEFPLAKLSWGLVTQSSLAGSLLLVVVSRLSGDTEPRFLAILGARTLAYVGVCWSVAFALAALGRLRWLGYSTLLVGLLLLKRRGVELSRIGPLELLAPGSFPFERESFPVRALIEAGVLAAAAVLLGLGLPLLREGSVAERLARPASAGEKTAFWGVLAAQLALAVVVPSAQPHKPLGVTGSGALVSERANVHVRYEDAALEPPAREALATLEQLSARLRTELHVSEPPALHLMHVASASGLRFARADGGVLIEANLAQLDRVDLALWAAQQSFQQLSVGRSSFEPNRWFAEGFASYWAPPAEPAVSEQRWLHALVVRRRLSLDAQQLEGWERLFELAGREGALSLGFTLVELLEQQHGRERVLELARALLVRPTVRNGFDSFFAERADFPAALERATGERWTDFVAAYHGQLDAAEERLAARLAAVPAFTATVRMVATDVGNDLLARVSGPALAAPLPCELRHASLPPYDLAVQAGAVRVLGFEVPAGLSTHDVPLRGQYQSGQRAFAAVDCGLPGLRRYARLEARRLEVP